MFEPEIRKFRRAAAQRLASAELLLKFGLNLDSMYLAGYVAECALKALILDRTPPGQRGGMLQKIATGQKAHDFEYLKATLKGLGCSTPPEAAAFLRAIASWSTGLRYEVGYVAHEDARDFLAAARGIRDWVERSL